MICNPIGFFYTDATYKYEVPRQGVFSKKHSGEVHLNAQMGFEQALMDLEGFDRVWLLFQFHHNHTWKPVVQPPVAPADKNSVGLFATRSPYRPNSIGMSAVPLVKVEGLKLFVEGCDLLNETPILDIKPYIPRIDAFPEAIAGWTENQKIEFWSVLSEALFEQQSQWILQEKNWDLHSFAQLQLSENPLDKSRKRVKVLKDSKNQATLAFRTFRIHFNFDETSKSIILKSISSAYTAQDLNSSKDPYQDKALHLAYHQNFSLKPKP